MLIRKSKVLNEIDAMIEDSKHFMDIWQGDDEDSKTRRLCMKSEIDALSTLRYFLKHKHRCRPLKERG